jgi:hypothetical protein
MDVWQPNAPESLYKSFGGSFKQLQCVLHELGSNHKCRSENYANQKGTGAIVGLHSNWIGDSILACARPSDRIIKDHRLIHQVLPAHLPLCNQGETIEAIRTVMSQPIRTFGHFNDERILLFCFAEYCLNKI